MKSLIAFILSSLAIISLASVYSISNLCNGFSSKPTIKMGCVTPYDALLILANLNQIISEVNADPMFNPIFDTIQVNKCYVMKTNDTYMKLFSFGPRTFIQDEMIVQINPFLASNGSTCLNKGDAKMVIYFLNAKINLLYYILISNDKNQK